ncbi:MAG: 2Fe-2S iron-sulfur cluster-binding protein [Nanoarchaeota archaeon]|nr:2Fe-2S iron-sulfur cluster-binding protein [Nanoarchaeota archaeon]
MAELTDGVNTVKVEDGAEVKDACKELGVVFGCEDGLCGTCLVEVPEGLDNLSERTQAEKDMGVEDNNRLMCQCKIKCGKVKILY